VALKVTVNMPEDIEELEEILSTVLAKIIAKKLQPEEFEEFKGVFLRDEIGL